MKKTLLTLVAILCMSLGMAQNPASPQAGQGAPQGQRPQRLSVAEVNAKMQEELKLDAAQQKDVEKLNKKYSSLYEGMAMGGGAGGGRSMGGGRPMGGGGGGDFGGGDFGGGGAPMGGGMGNANSVRFTPSQTTPEQLAKKQQIQQEAYEKKLKKILTEEQYATYEKIFPALMPKPGQRPGGGQGRPQGN